MVNNREIVLSPVLAEAQAGRLNKRLEDELIEVNRELSSLVNGKLHIRVRNSRIQFNHYMNGQVKGITGFPDKVYQLARREYLELHAELLEQILYEGWTKNTRKIIGRIYPRIEDLLKKYEDVGLDIELITMTPSQRIWNSDRHSQKENRRDELIYPTRGGVYMRTLSERFIGNLLEMLHIPYRYETRLMISNRSYHPDFIIMLPDGRLVILEHVGRMDLREYDEDLIIKLQAYDSIGLMIGRHVFMTFNLDVREESRVREVLFQMLTSNPPWNKTLISAARRAGCRISQTA